MAFVKWSISIIREHIENLEQLSEDPPEGLASGELPEMSFTRHTVRGRPALLVEAPGYGFSILTIEGGGVTSMVTGTHFPKKSSSISPKDSSLDEFETYVREH